MAFVRAYWQTVKSGDFPMPPNEPVEKTLEELIAAVSHEIEMDSSSTHTAALYKLHMVGEHEAWWDFRFL